MASYRCPYCHAVLPPPAEWSGAACPQCRRTVLLPDGVPARRARAEARREALERIRRDADAERRRRGLDNVGGLRAALRRPGLAFGALVAVVLIGGQLIMRSGVVGRTPADREATARRELSVLATAAGLYKAHTGHYPTADEGGMAAFVLDPGTDGWAGPYISSMQPDPWGLGYVYDFASDPPTIFSRGPDKRSGTADDLRAEPSDFIPTPSLLARWPAPSAVRHPAPRIAPIPSP